MLAKLSLAVALLAGVSLLAINAGQAERNTVAQADATRSLPTPAWSQQLNRQIAAAATMAGPTAPQTTVNVGGTAIRSVGFTFPAADYEFPPGPDVEVVTSNCTACHSPGMILTQPKLSPAAWTGEVQKMQHTYKAPVSDADVPAIVAYLSTLPHPGQDR